MITNRSNTLLLHDEWTFLENETILLLFPNKKKADFVFSHYLPSTCGCHFILSLLFHDKYNMVKVYVLYFRLNQKITIH